MGTKVQLDSYYSMRDLNHDLNGTSWPSYCGESNLPNGQYYYGVLPRPNPDLFPGVDKDLLKQKMLEHETVFKNQVFELHRLYRVQRDLMDEIRKKEETSSSSSPFASQTTPEDAHRRTSSNFLFSNSVCGEPPVSGPEFIGSSAGGSLKGKNVQGVSLAPFPNCDSPRNSEVSESRPTKLRRMIDLQLPADEYLDTDEVEQCENTKYQEIASRSSVCLRKPNAVADLNEPPETEETSEDVLWKPNYGNINGTQSNSRYNDKGNGENWFSSMLKAGGSNGNGKSIDQWPAKANDGFNVFDKSRCLSSFNNSAGLMASQLPSYVSSSSLVNSWDPSHGKPSSYLSQKPISVQTTPFLGSASLSKSSQSPAQNNGFLGAWWHRNADPRSNPGYGSTTPVQNGFYHGSSSGEHKELPSQFSKASLDYVTTSYNDNPASGSSDFLKGRNSFDLNSTGELNLNVALPNGLSDESPAPQGEAKREDPVSVLPWLRAKASNNEASSSRNFPNEPKSGVFHDPGELCNRSEVRNTLDHQDSIASSSYNVDATGGKKKLILDINVPCEESEEFENVAAASKVVLIEDEKIETGCPNGVRHMFDLNSCLTEDEIPSCTTTNNTKRPEGCIIDLEAPIDLVDDEEITNVVVGEVLDEELVKVAAEAIVTISSFVTENRVEDETAASKDDALVWFVDIVCSRPDEVKSCPDYFEEMTLKLTECTVEEYFPKPPIFDIPMTVEETETGTANVTGRARRGPARRGRQKRDFQRDILPGLGTLARHEVTEDLQTFGGLMRATGHAWQCGTRRNSVRNGSGRRGRRKAVAEIPPPPPPAIDATTTTAFASPQKNGEITVLEDRSLTSWGKTTRRPRRQRCPPPAAGNPAPIALT